MPWRLMSSHDLEDGVHEDGGEAHRRLVEEEQARPRHQRAPDGQHLLLAPGQRAALLGGALAQAREQREHALEVGRDRVAVGAGEGAHLQVLEHGHAREDPATLRRLRDPQAHDAVGGEAVEALPVEDHGAPARPHRAEDGAEGGGLAGAVGADEGDDLPRLDGERDPAQGADIAVVGVHVVEGEHARYRAPPGAAGSGS